MNDNKKSQENNTTIGREYWEGFACRGEIIKTFEPNFKSLIFRDYLDVADMLLLFPKFNLKESRQRIQSKRLRIHVLLSSIVKR